VPVSHSEIEANPIAPLPAPQGPIELVSASCSSDQLIKLDLHSPSIAVLRILNEKYHEECHNRRRCVYHPMPRVAKMKDGTADNPRGYNA
jgi:hypothetical protein